MNVYNYKAPDVVIKRSMEELNTDYIGYKIIEKRLFDYFITVKRNTHVEMLDKEADIIWHNYILNTRSYREFCSKYFNMFIEHEPYLNDNTLTQDEVLYTAKIIVDSVKDYRKRNYLNEMDEGHYLVDNDFFDKIRKEIK